jgi:hypothetical protein
MRAREARNPREKKFKQRAVGFITRLNGLPSRGPGSREPRAKEHNLSPGYSTDRLALLAALGAQVQAGRRAAGIAYCLSAIGTRNYRLLSPDLDPDLADSSEIGYRLSAIGYRLPAAGRTPNQITAPPSERRGWPGARHFARWKQIGH